MTTADTEKFSKPLSRWLSGVLESKNWRDRQQARVQFTPQLLEECSKWDLPTVNYIVDRLFNHPLDSFEPRPDTEANGMVDEQTGFIDSKSFISMAVGGNGSGKTYCGAQKCAQFLNETAPPKVDTPFWIIGNTYDLTINATWKQKLSTIIPDEWIDWPRVTWLSTKKNMPVFMPLKSRDDTGNNWAIEWKSYEQGRELMQAAAIGGAWFTEQFPYEVFLEVLRGCRELAFPGAIFAEFTPVDPEKSIDIEIAYEGWLAGEPEYSSWSFYRLNTEVAMQAGHVDRNWFDTFFSAVSEEMMATRKAGTFASYENAIFQGFSPRLHLVESSEYEIPPSCIHKRAIDWGASEEHPFVCLWGAKDGMGRWIIYDEFWSISQTELVDDKVKEIKSRRFWANDPYHRQTYGDPSRPDQFREFAARGIPVSSANNQVYEGIESVRKLLKLHSATDEPQLIIFKDKCPVLARQMATYRWEKSSGRGINPKSARPQPLKANDDSVDALRYLIHSDKKANAEGIKSSYIAARERKTLRHRQTQKSL